MRFPNLLICAVLPVTVAIAGPAHLYFTNAAEFSAPFADHLRYLVPVAIAGFVLLLAVTSLLSRWQREWTMAGLFALSVLVWLQGNVLVFDYGPLDGRGLQWHGKGVESSIEIAAWVSVLVLAAWQRKWISRVAATGSAIVLFMQFGAVAMQTAAADPARSSKPADEVRAQLHALSAQRNVIVLILDTFQGDLFKQRITLQPSFAELFDGFTYFMDTVGSYPTTAASIPMMLTGQVYENEEPLVDFTRERLATQSLPSLLRDAGYQVDLMPLTRYVMSCNIPVASNCIELRRAVQEDDSKQAFDEATRLLDVTLFRHAPHYLKPAVYNEGNWRVVDALQEFGVNSIQEGYWLDTAFIEQFRERAVVSEALAGTLKLYHLIGMHPPYRLNDNCEDRDITETKDSAMQRRIALAQTGCVLAYVGDFLQHLKALGVYDDALIVVAGDHGTTGPMNIGVNASVMEPASATAASTNGATDRITKVVMASSVPMLLIKPPGATGPMVSRRSPTALCDLPKTVADALSLKHDFPCEDAFAVTDDSRRERRYLFYQWDDDFWQTDRLPNMHEYLIDGPPWRLSSWTSTARVFSPNGVSVGDWALYTLGDTLTFGNAGSVTPYLGRGWAAGPDSATWASGVEADLTLPLGVDAPARLSGTLRLTADIAQIAEARMDEPQRVEVHVGGRRVGVWRVEGPGAQTLSIPAELMSRYGRLRIRFKWPYAGASSRSTAAQVPADGAFALGALTLSAAE